MPVLATVFTPIASYFLLGQTRASPLLAGDLIDCRPQHPLVLRLPFYPSIPPCLPPSVGIHLCIAAQYPGVLISAPEC
ncbi:hypothetical protein PR002_g12236 [Phytophthora rubi]|uniref:Uncharacterized protein n=1 Tax=Phytophthora rubi TaxID=129364 RepID=A0A6A3LPI7_9STRA|nr:hypothetical protein PR002_g12236 [Phytophthora rubi]